MTREAILTEALDKILKGSAPTGRWLPQYGVFRESLSSSDDPDVPPAGHHNDEFEFPGEEPEVYPPVPKHIQDMLDGHDIQMSQLVCSEEDGWLLPALWQPYSQEEQTQWLESVAGIAKTALDAAGQAHNRSADERIEELLRANNVLVDEKRDARHRVEQLRHVLDVIIEGPSARMSTPIGLVTIDVEGMRQMADAMGRLMDGLQALKLHPTLIVAIAKGLPPEVVKGAAA